MPRRHGSASSSNSLTLRYHRKRDRAERWTDPSVSGRIGLAVLGDVTRCCVEVWAAGRGCGCGWRGRDDRCGWLGVGEAVHRDHLDGVSPGQGAVGEPGLEDLLGAAGDHVQQPRRAGAIRMPVRSMITVTYLSPLRVWRHTCSSTPIAVTPSNRCSSSIKTRRPSARTASLAVFHDTARASATRATVRCCTTIPSSAHRSPRRDSFRPGLGGLGGVLAPHVTTAGALVPPNRDQQRGRPPPERLVRELPGHDVARRALATAATTPLIRCDDPARQDSPIRFEPLPGDNEAEFVEPSKRGQIWGERAVRGCVGTGAADGSGDGNDGNRRQPPAHVQRHLHREMLCEQGCPNSL